MTMAHLCSVALLAADSLPFVDRKLIQVKIFSEAILPPAVALTKGALMAFISSVMRCRWLLVDIPVAAVWSRGNGRELHGSRWLVRCGHLGSVCASLVCCIYLVISLVATLVLPVGSR
jgi:hypothetical protein